MTPDLDPSTVVVHAGRPERVPDAPLGGSPVFSSTYLAGGQRGYGRFDNDAWAALEQTLGALEGGRGLTFASGMAAVAALLDLVPVGGRVVAPQHAYSGVLGLLDQQASTGRVQLQRVDIADTEAVTAAVAGADLLWIESPTNPAMEVADLPALCAAGRAAGTTVVVDNTFATPLLQRPLAVGADVVMHSATKFIAGHSDVVLGAIVTADDKLWTALETKRRSLGAIPGPMEAWLALRGLRTLALRLDRAQANAAFLAERLLEHPRVSRVRYPGLPDDPGHVRAKQQMSGFGAILAIELGGDADRAQRVCESTKLWVHATSVGGVESMLERRRRWPAEVPTIPADLIRLSVGIEHPNDLWTDLAQALES
ncbi:Cys/Met metabolism pyridoxal-phosphate-dependent protein [Kribbella flavida DSM 17836]|uniref:homocysteine desulfhydrase n=1 Tax=Kribbella flavida (strain DSM 17836 / JCM 10339 / NBRC 14399) TaxID=479435 RepID=D2Q0Q9_KRIFD|nr:aminotransferase class I/II-fold pyridoxal phosphate-dependent enzyme [Kribbella flavida]ADB33859.1 Cys/Met metabolism pyridoxal-phosphate-dependent protein [Kribbella flavida DSM 17836]